MKELVAVRLLGKDAVLRAKSRDVPIGRDIKNLITQMRGTMGAHDGIGIAAPQVGESLRIFLIARELFSPAVQAKLPSDVFVNPKIIKKSFKREPSEEGCLSAPGIFGEAARARRITVEAYDSSWKKFRVSANGLLARVLQHEFDHLVGILFIDRAKKETLHEVLPDGTVRPWAVLDMH